MKKSCVVYKVQKIDRGPCLLAIDRSGSVNALILLNRDKEHAAVVKYGLVIEIQEARVRY